MRPRTTRAKLASVGFASKPRGADREPRNDPSSPASTATMPAVVVRGSMPPTVGRRAAAPIETGRASDLVRVRLGAIIGGGEGFPSRRRGLRAQEGEDREHAPVVVGRGIKL